MDKDKTTKVSAKELLKSKVEELKKEQEAEGIKLKAAKDIAAAETVASKKVTPDVGGANAPSSKVATGGLVASGSSGGIAAGGDTTDGMVITRTPVTPTPQKFGKFVIRKAERSSAKLRIGLSGPSGSGKTYTSLLLAHGMANWEKIGIIDTENGSADLYSQLGPFNVLTLEKPFSPERYIEAIEALEEAGMEVIIIDSITHEWNGPGGCLEIQEKLGGRFQDWAQVTPKHSRFIQKILLSKCHILATMRTKTEYSISNESGKSKVMKLGSAPITREGFEYEMTLGFEININNMAVSTKDRTGLFKGNAGEVLTEEHGKQLLAWATSGVDYFARINELLKAKGKSVEPILQTYRVLVLEDISLPNLKGIIARLESLPDVQA